MKRMIGFRLSSYAAGSIAVAPVDHLCHIPERMKSAIKVQKILFPLCFCSFIFKSFLLDFGKIYL